MHYFLRAAKVELQRSSCDFRTEGALLHPVGAIEAGPYCASLSGRGLAVPVVSGARRGD
jgi:hypothetical protein